MRSPVFPWEMCIRDSYGGVKAYQGISNSECRVDDVWESDYPRSVSYTHLDVYKRQGYECVVREHACAAGMPVKDTVKIVDDNNIVSQTPERKYEMCIRDRVRSDKTG